MDSEFFKKSQDKIDQELEEEKVHVALSADYSLKITPRGEEVHFKMKEPYFSILELLTEQERHPISPEDVITSIKTPFIGKARVVEALKELIHKGYITTEKF